MYQDGSQSGIGKTLTSKERAGCFEEMNFLGWSLNSSERSELLWNKLFSKIGLQNPAKGSFMYRQWTPTVDILVEVSTTDSLAFCPK